MKEQQVVYSDTGEDINKYIKQGWRVVSVTAGHVATSNSFSVHGRFIFILEK
jgi:hypothetical protein